MSTSVIDWQGAAFEAADRAYRFFTRKSVDALLARAESGEMSWSEVRLLLVDNTHAKEREAESFSARLGDSQAARNWFGETA